MDVEKLANKTDEDTAFKSISQDMANIALREPSVDKESSPRQPSLETSNVTTDDHTVIVTTTKWEIWAYYVYYIGNA